MGNIERIYQQEAARRKKPASETGEEKGGMSATSMTLEVKTRKQLYDLIETLQAEVLRLSHALEAKEAELGAEKDKVNTLTDKTELLKNAGDHLAVCLKTLATYDEGMGLDRTGERQALSDWAKARP